MLFNKHSHQNWFSVWNLPPTCTSVIIINCQNSSLSENLDFSKDHGNMHDQNSWSIYTQNIPVKLVIINMRRLTLTLSPLSLAGWSHLPDLPITIQVCSCEVQYSGLC